MLRDFLRRRFDDVPPKGNIMSRAINLSLPEAEVKTRCEDAGISISAIEPLPAGGTRLVCTTDDGAEKFRRKHKDAILSSRQKRSPFFVPTLQRQ
jgi:hypothetical protein